MTPYRREKTISSVGTVSGKPALLRVDYDAGHTGCRSGNKTGTVKSQTENFVSQIVRLRDQSIASHRRPNSALEHVTEALTQLGDFLIKQGFVGRRFGEFGTNQFAQAIAQAMHGHRQRISA